MPSDRRFWRTVIRWEVLSEEQIPQGMSIERIWQETVYGDWSGRVLSIQEKSLTGVQAARALQLQGSDPEFFGLDEAGNDAEV
jgi:hypothetical protein